MRHRVNKHHFNRDTKSRVALIRNLLRALIEHGSIVTTQAKAKEIKRQIDKLMTLAKTNTLANKRVLHEFFGKRDVVSTLIERIAPLFTDRNSGFTTISNFGKRRGDNAVLAQISFLKQPELNHTLEAPVGKRQKNLAKTKTKLKPVTKNKVTKIKTENKPKAQKAGLAKKTSQKKPKKILEDKKVAVVKTKVKPKLVVSKKT